MNRSTPGPLVHHQLPEFTQTHVHWVSDAIQMLKLKLQYFGHLIRRVDSLEKTLMLGGIGGRRRRATIWPCNSTPSHIVGEKYDPKGYIHLSVHCSTVYHCQDTEATKTQSYGYRKCGTYIQWNIIHLIKEWNNTIYNNMDGPRDCHTEWNKSEKEMHAESKDKW